MTKQQFAQSIKQKYPQYTAVPDEQLADRVLAKYPQYSRAIDQEKSVGGFIQNAGKSAIDAAGGIVSSAVNIANPNLEKNTLANLARLGASVISVALPGEQGNEDLARQVGQYYADRYGGLDKAWNSFYNDPVGVAMDASTVLGGAGAIAKAAGGVSKIGGLTRAGSALSAASRIADPITFVGGVIGRKGASLANKVPAVLDEASSGLLTRGLGQPKAIRAIEDVGGRSAGQIISDYNLFDRSPDSANAAISGIDAARLEKVGQATKGVNTGSLLKAFDAEIAKLAKEAQFSDFSASQLEELVKRRKAIEGALTQGDAVPLEFSPASAIEMKRMIGKDIRPTTFGMDSAATGRQEASRQAYRSLIEGIDEAVPGTKQLGRDEAALIKMRDLFENSGSRKDAKQLINFSRLGTAGLGGVLAGLPGAAVGYAAEQVANSPQALRAMSGGMRIGSSALKNPIVKNTASKVSNASAKIYDLSKVSSRLPSQSPSSTPQTMRMQESKQTEVGRSAPAASPNYTTPILPKGYKPKTIEYKAPSVNVFKNKAAFGKKIRLGEQGGGNPFGQVIPKIKAAHQAVGNAYFDVADNPRNAFRQAVDRVPGGQVLREQFFTPRAEAQDMARTIRIDPRTAGPVDQRKYADTAVNMAMMMGLASPGRVPRIPRPTQDEMAGFIDYVRLKQPFSHSMELDASRIAEKYGLKMPKSTRGLANVFDRTLSKLKYKL